MAANGEVTLVWAGPSVSDDALASTVEIATVGPSGAQAGPVALAAVQRTRRKLSYPALALAPSGRAAVAWFEERSTGSQYTHEILSLRVRDRLPGGGMEPPRTVWQAAPVFRGAEDGLTIATDSAGDEVLAWLAQPQSVSDKWAVMVSSRHAGGAFTAPVELTDNTTEVIPAVAMTANGEATVVWTGADSQQVLASTWAAGSQPAPATVLDRYIPAGRLASFERFRAVQIASSGSGDELITWLYGLPPSGTRPHVSSLNAAWRLQGAGIGPTQTVSAPLGEARDPAVALGAEGQALIAWGEITGSGGGPTLDYATAAPGGAFDPATTVGSLVGEAPQLAVAWLPGAGALMSWQENNTVLAAHWLPGGSFPVPTAVTHLDEFGRVVMAAGGSGDPVFAWISSSELGLLDEQVRYTIVSGLDGPAHPVVASVLALTGSRNLRRARGVRVLAECAERCTVNATAGMFARADHAVATRAQARDYVGAFAPVQQTLAGGHRALLRLQMGAGLLRAYCHVRRRDEVNIEVHVSAYGRGSGASQTATLGDFPAGEICAR